MQKSIRLITLATALGTTLLTTSCGSKTDDPQAQTQTAVLSGQVTPAASVTAVTATDISGKAYTATVTSMGTYAFAAMPVGDYTLTFSPATGYAAPASVAAKLAASGTAVAAITVVLAKAAVSFQVDGVAVTAPYAFSQTLSNDRFLTFSVSPGGAPGPTVSINMAGLTPAVGTYSLDNSSSNAQYMTADYISYYSAKFGTGSATSGAARPKLGRVV
ncbi:MAG: carboxypeptidase regulatory-like domain-containing protein, partial [Hymenobacter sp.]